MAKIKVMGDAAVVTSSLKMADIEKLYKFNKEALTFKNKETKEPVFAIGINGTARLTKLGVHYNGVNEKGYAIATLALPTGLNKEQKQEYLSDTYAPALHALNIAETEIGKAFDTLKKEIETAEKNITFVEEE